MKKLIITLKYVFILFVVLVNNIFTAQSQRPDINPYDPREAFDQTKIYQKFPGGLENEIRDAVLATSTNPDVIRWDEQRKRKTICCVLSCGISSCFDMTSLFGRFSCFKTNTYQQVPANDELVEFSANTRTVLNARLVDDFFKKKYDATMRPIYQDIMGLGAFGVLLGGVPALVPIGAMGGSFANLILLYQGSDVLNNVRRVVTSNLTSRNDPLLVYEISYVLLKRYLPRKLQEKIEIQFSVGLANTMNLEGPSLFFDTALALPREILPISKEGIALGTFVKTYLQDYPEMKVTHTGIEAKTGIEAQKEFLTPLLIHLKQQALARKYLYIESAAGTGKTTFCRKLAKFFGIPFISVKMSSTIDDFIGSKDKPGSLLSAITSEESKGAKNALILIDEAESLFDEKNKVGLAKTVFDPKDPGFHSDFLGIRIPLNDYLIVFCANAPIPAENDPQGAMKSRTIPLHLGDLITPAKQRILKLDKFPELQKSISVELDETDWTAFESQNPLTQNMRALEAALQEYMRNKNGEYAGLN